jgi:hypothetical protein
MCDLTTEPIMSPGEIAYLALFIAAFLIFILAVGGLQYWLSRTPSRATVKTLATGIRRAH